MDIWAQSKNNCTVQYLLRAQVFLDVDPGSRSPLSKCDPVVMCSPGTGSLWWMARSNPLWLTGFIR